MDYGAWIHTGGGLSLEEQLPAAKAVGIESIRSYSYHYSEHVAPALKAHGMGLLAGMHIDADGLLADWRSQVHLDVLARYHDLGVPLRAICVGNELREGGDDPSVKRFSARIAFGLANVLQTYRRWLDDHGFATPLTYAMESIVHDDTGTFYEWVLPVLDACDRVGLNAYPMGHWEWFTFRAFEESRRFLQEGSVRRDRLAQYEARMRRVMQQLQAMGKAVILTETGFPSAVGYHIEDERMVIPENAPALYEAAMREFLGRLKQISADYHGAIQAIYFYEWRDNLYHNKIWNVEQSPIHVAFGLCERDGTPKFDIADVLRA